KDDGAGPALALDPAPVEGLAPGAERTAEQLPHGEAAAVAADTPAARGPERELRLEGGQHAEGIPLLLPAQLAEVRHPEGLRVRGRPGQHHRERLPSLLAEAGVGREVEPAGPSLALGQPRQLARQLTLEGAAAPEQLECLIEDGPVLPPPDEEDPARRLDVRLPPDAHQPERPGEAAGLLRVHREPRPPEQPP